MTWQALEAVLDGMGYEYARQGSYAEQGDLPATFLTFWNIETPEARFYDDAPTVAVWTWQVYLYTKDPSIMYSAMDRLVDSARAQGFVPDGRAWDIDAGEPGYVGRTVRLRYVQDIQTS